MKAVLTLISFGGVLGLYLGALISDLRTEHRLEKRQPLKAGDKEYTVKILEIEYFGSLRSEDGDNQKETKS